MGAAPTVKQKDCTPEQFNTHCRKWAESLQLHGKPLEPPRFHRTGWRENQTFSAKDDPDRVLEPWDTPFFVQTKDPLIQRNKLTFQELDLTGLSHASDSFARVVHNVLDEEDCAELVARVNQKGFTPALINVGHGNQVLMPKARDGHRVIVESSELAHWIFEVIRPHLPEQRRYPTRTKDIVSDLIDLNERCRFLCYTPGQHFAPHHDGLYERPREHPNYGDFSAVTLQLYLHDVPKANGGGTTFLNNIDKPVLACQPGAGSMLLFSQDLYHEGSRVNRGIKYTFRTEAMYRRRQPYDTYHSW